MAASIKEESLVVITWNGKDQPFNSVFFDTAPDFKILLFNYSGVHCELEQTATKFDILLEAKTECKGQVMLEVYNYLQADSAKKYVYIGFIDDDILIKISDINFLLHIAKVYQLDAFQPSIYRDSFHSYKYNLREPSILMSTVNWVEIMSPFFRYTLFEACGNFLTKSISSYGIDCYVIPFYQKLLNMNKAFVIHAVSIHHHQEITSSQRRYSNGLTAAEEGEKIRTELLDIIADEYPYLLKDKKFMAEIFKYKVGLGYSISRFFNKLRMILRYYIKEIKIIYRRVN